MTKHYRWETTLAARRAQDPGIDDPERRAAAREAGEVAVLGEQLARMRRQRGLSAPE